MKCQKCGGGLKVIDTVHTDENEIYRKRKCLDCGHIIYTAEYLVFPNEEFMDEWHAAYRQKAGAVKNKRPKRKVRHAFWHTSVDVNNFTDINKAKCSSCGETVKIGRESLPHRCPGCDAVMDR